LLLCIQWRHICSVRIAKRGVQPTGRVRFMSFFSVGEEIIEEQWGNLQGVVMTVGEKKPEREKGVIFRIRRSLYGAESWKQLKTETLDFVGGRVVEKGVYGA